MPDPSPDTPNVCPTAPDGFVACRTTHGPGGSSTVQVTHLVRLDAHGSNGGRPTMCGLTRFDKRSPDGWDVIELAAIPGWSMGAGGIFGPGITQKACDACWTAARPAAGSFPPDVTALADELRDWPYGRPAFVRSEAEQAADALEAQATRITELERWKAEALVVLGQWDEVWEALGRPGPLGSSKAVEALTEAHRLRATDPPADVHPRHPRQETT